MGLAGPAIDLTLVADDDGFSGYGKTIDVMANVYFIHFGDNSLAFGFGDKQNSFTFSGLPRELSNFRAYTCDNCGTFGTRSLPEVPIPAAAWLFGSGLIGLIGIARRRAS